MEIETSIEGLTKIKHLCRICLTEGTKMMELNSYIENRKSHALTILETLKRTFGVKIILDERYPSRVCGVCSSLTKICYDFKLQFESSQVLLHKYLGNNEAEDDLSAQVELISKQGVYNLKDVLIVEEEERQMDNNYEGFLKNLGNEISASYVFSNTSEDKQQFESENEKLKRECHQNFSCNRTLKTKTFICEVCGVITQSKSGLYKHINKQHGRGGVKCDICDKFYSNATLLKVHIATIHDKQRNLLCTTCGKTFNYSSALTYHMRIHNDERNYKCTYCPKTFRMQCSLKRHLRTHTGIRPYKCNYCGNAFRSSGELSCHEMIHTGYRPYHCKYCNKGFTKTFNLKVHLLNHKGPYVCEFCDKSFIEQQFLKVHIEKTHFRLSDINGE